MTHKITTSFNIYVGIIQNLFVPKFFARNSRKMPKSFLPSKKSSILMLYRIQYGQIPGGALHIFRVRGRAIGRVSIFHTVV